MDPLPEAFTWYALVRRASGEVGEGLYADSIVKLGQCENFAQFAALFHHIQKPGQVFDGVHGWLIERIYLGYGMCLFRAAVRPEWEDPQNQHGIDLVHRSHSMSPKTLDDVWTQLLLDMINGRLPEATGVRLVHKREHHTRKQTHKIEVWCEKEDQAESVKERLQQSVGVAFAPFRRRCE